ncbi:CDP-glucose 4,6-dehydratase [[Clostridium] hylemonae DSM 15053]|uniref:CDP-glucose 4,6-dehydratase n=2 Tax=[Clostridium] hylemonae TaxID=89153 RepID=C0C2E4_9FIRM|nr:CDP-glucose 4,6-dehydratase [[Clostridium] hylemonae]EEG73568.1 CDP-glucose 4,6-dehydratase [[Clostridium] hylemonae DSM 15053]QEK17170.1 CDP-glucose 4,6-dehydratase [[Clostridium] hylemonae DSM 15053]
MNFNLDFFKDKKILITGHTGFKGSWMCKMLTMAGAEVTGYALEPPTNPNLFTLCKIADGMRSVLGDVRDLPHLKEVFTQIQPEIVIHMAAQPLVRESYQNPVYTYEANVMGTVNVLECIRMTPSVKSVVNVTTDKVYLNREWEWGYRENEMLNGYDPYSNSKSCAELVTSSYVNSYFNNMDIAVTTCRAGNVIGGGDFASDRILPDCIRAAAKGMDIIVRNPFSTRPYQHVLEPVAAYLLIAQMQYDKKELAGNYNIGPDESECWTTEALVDLFCKKWEKMTGNAIKWINKYDGGPHEANFLKLDCSKVKKVFGWRAKWDIDTAMDKIIEWSECYINNADIEECMENQIMEFCNL